LKRNSSEPRLYYPALLFATILPLSISRPVAIILENAGRNSVWILFPALLVIIAGVWASLRISKRCGGVSLMLACGELTFRWMARVAYFLYALLFLGIASYAIALSGDFSSRVGLYGDSRTSILADALITTCAALFPIETLIRYAQLIIVFVTPILTALSLSMLADAQWSWLYPAFNAAEIVDPLPLIAAIMCIFSPLATITLISRKDTRVSFLSLSGYLLLIALLFSFAVAMVITTFGIHSARHMEYAVFYAENAVHLESSIFQRFIFLSSVFLLFFKFIGKAFLMRCAALSLAQSFGARIGIGPVVLAGGIVAVVFWKVDLLRFFRDVPLWLGYYGFSLIVVFPVLIYVILLLRGKKA